MYIKQLELSTQKAIEKELTTLLQGEGLQGYDLHVAVQNGLDSKLSDLQGMIDIDKVKEANKKSILISTLEYMQEFDPDGTWSEAAERIAHFEIVERHDITYLIETLTDWKGELVNDNDKQAERMKMAMNGHIERLKNLIEQS